MHLLQLFDNFRLIHLLYLRLFDDVADIVNNTRSLIRIAEAIVLLFSSVVPLLFTMFLFQCLEAIIH